MRVATISSNDKVSRLVVSWVLMIPLLFLAIDGRIRIGAYGGNNAIEANYTSLIPLENQGFPIMAHRLVMGICALLFLTRLKQVVDITRNNKTFVALCMLAIVSVMWSQFPMDSLMNGIYVTMNISLAFYLAARFTPDRQMELFLTFGWIIIVPCIFADLFFPQYGLDNQGGHLRGAWMGIFNTHDACSITVAFLLSVPFYMRPSSSFSRLARIVYIVLSLLLIVMSQGRTGWIVAAFLLLYVSVTKYLKRYRAKDVIPIAFLSGAAAVVAVAGVVQYYTAIVLLLGKDPTLTGRTAIWRLSIAAAMKRPLLGYGYRAFWHGLQGESANLSLAGGWIIPAAHNGFLDLWLGLGAVGVGAVVYSMFRAAKNAFTCFRAGSSSAAEWYLCIVFVTIVSNVAQLTLMVPSYLGWTLYVLACIGLSQEARRVRLGMVHA